MKCGTLNEKNVRVCASGQVYCLTLPVAFRAVATVWTRNPKKKVLQINNYGFSVVEVCNKKCYDGGHVMMSKNSDLVFEIVLNKFPSARIDFLRPESMLSHLTTFQTTHCLSIRVDASPKSRRTRSTRMNLVSRKKRMSAEVVLLQNNRPN